MPDNEGYIKFKYDWEKKPFSFPESSFQEINSWRQKLYEMNLIGMYENGIGFGNISIRVEGTNEFIITGSATGNVKKLTHAHYALVNHFDIGKNFVKCTGETRASSESLTHAAVYTANPTMNAVIHTHNIEMWKKFLNKKPSTSAKAEFGTPELAKEIKELIKNEEVVSQKIIVMAGHREGLLTFGRNADEAGEAMLKYFQETME
ncbi:MAG: class II aldolase/adducin family protein [bacterium]